MSILQHLGDDIYLYICFRSQSHCLGMAAINETRYTGVWVRRLEEDGASSLVYPNTVSVSTVYDPKVWRININSPHIVPDKLVTGNDDCHRGGVRVERVCHQHNFWDRQSGEKGNYLQVVHGNPSPHSRLRWGKFLDFAQYFVLINSIQKDSNKFSDSIAKIREDKNTSVFR